MTENNKLNEREERQPNLSRRAVVSLLGMSVLGSSAATSAYSELTADRPIDVEVVETGVVETGEGSSELLITNNADDAINAAVRTDDESVSLVSSDVDVSDDNPWTASAIVSGTTATLTFEHADTDTLVDFDVTAFAGTSGFSIATGQSVSVELKSDVMAEYSFEDDSDTSTAIDTAGSFNGSITGGSYSTDAKVDSLSMSFSGDFADEIFVGDFDGATTGESNFTVTGWTKINSTETRNPLVTKGRTRSSSVDWAIGAGDSALYVHVNDATSVIADAGSVALDTWTFFTLVVDSDELRAYIDAEQVGSVGYSGSLSNEFDVRIGANSDDQNSVNGSVSGNVDEIRVWDRALTDAEIDDEFQRRPSSEDTSEPAEASFTLSQDSNSVEHLGRDVFHDTAGHNTLTVDVTGSDLSHCFVELSLNGGDFVPMQKFDETVFEQPVSQSHDGVAIDSISIREAIDVRWQDDTRDTLQLFYGSGGADQAIYKVESNGDPTSFSTPQEVHDEGSKTQDPNIFYDRSDRTLYMFYEDGGPSGQSHGHVGILEADTLAGESWGNKQLIGGSNWGPNTLFASPTMFKINETYFIAGEEHDTSSYDLMMAQGDSPTNWTDSKIIEAVAEYPDVRTHINLQGPSWYSKDGTLYSYTNVQWESDGAFRSAIFHTSEFDADGYPTNWTLGERIDGYVISGLIRYFNDMYVYGYDPSNSTEIVYWDLDGDRIDKPLSTSGGKVAFEFYEPTAPDGATVEWRAVAVDTNGNTKTSDTESFTVKSGS